MSFSFFYFYVYMHICNIYFYMCIYSYVCTYTFHYLCNVQLSFLSTREARSVHQLKSDVYVPSQATGL